MPPISQNSRPLIVIVTLEQSAFYDELYTDFNGLLRMHADIERATTPSQVRAFLNHDIKPNAILSADASLTASTRTSLVHEVAGYVRSGGTLVFMGLFSSFTRPSDLGVLFARFNLPWTAGGYHRTTFALNPDANLLNTNGMASSYSQKAVHLANVSHSNAVYLPSDESKIESAVFAPLPIDDQTQTPTAFVQVGEGKVGYVGDINNEVDTMTVVLKMCGLNT